MSKLWFGFLFSIGLFPLTDGVCTDFSPPIPLLADSSVVLKYKSTETTLTVQLSSTSKNWLAFGLSPDGLMKDRTAVMGGGTYNIEVGKYDLYNRGVRKAPEERQTLIDSTFQQGDGGSVLTFTKLHIDGSDDEIISVGKNRFIWAMACLPSCSSSTQVE